MAQNLLFNQTPQQKNAVAQVFGFLKEFKNDKSKKRPAAAAAKPSGAFEYNLLSRPDQGSNLHPAAYLVPATQYDAAILKILEATFDKGVSFTFSEQLDNKHGALIFDLDLHIDPQCKGIQRKADIVQEAQQLATEHEWTDAQRDEHLDELLVRRGKEARVLTEEVLTSFMECVSNTLALFANPKKFKRGMPIAVDFHVRQRREPKLIDFDSGAKPYYDDGAHIQVNIDCTVEERIMIRHHMLESPYMTAWYTENIVSNLYEQAYHYSASSSSSASSSAFLRGGDFMDDQYALASIVDYGVTSGASAFSLIGTHKTTPGTELRYPPYVLSLFGSVLFRARAPENVDSARDVTFEVMTQYSMYHADVLRDVDQEHRRDLARPIKNCKTIRDLVMNNSISFSAISVNRRAYVSSLFGSALYQECMHELFPMLYKRQHSRFYTPVEGVNLIPNVLKHRGGAQQQQHYTEEEGDEEEEEEEEEEDEDEARGAGAKRKRDLDSLTAKPKKKTRGAEEEEEEEGGGVKVAAGAKRKRDATGSAAADPGKKAKKSKSEQLEEELQRAAQAAREGKEHAGRFDFRRFHDQDRGRAVLITEQQLMECTCMEQLEELYSLFVESVDKENPHSPGLNDDLRQAYMYTMALPEEYYCTGSRKKRIRVCWALRNISEFLLVVWVRFMFQRPEKDFTRMGEWIENWTSSRSYENESPGTANQKDEGQNHGYHLGSLRHWVKSHDPEKLDIITGNIFSKKVEKMIDDVTINVIMAAQMMNNQSRVKNICIGDYQMAQLAQLLVGDRIVLCSYPSSSNVMWMKYDDRTGLWKQHATGLSYELSVSLNQYFRQLFYAMADKIHAIPDSNKPAAEMKRETETLLRKQQEILNVQHRLSNHSSKCMIINEAKTLLYREKFMSTLDSKKFLFAFSNGVLDFSVSPPYFRKIEPGDFLSVSCGNLYLEEYDGTERTLHPDELKMVHNNIHEMIVQYGTAQMEAFPDKYQHLEEEDRIDQAAGDVFRADPSLLFDALPQRFQQIASEIKEYMIQMFENEVTRSYVYKLISIPLVGCTLKNQFAHLFTGKGNNGKSVFSVDLFKTLYQGYYYALDIRYWVQATGKAGGVQPELVQARPARWVPSFEPPKSSTVNENTLKLLVGGTDPINCRTLYEPPIQYTPQFTCSIISNHNLGMESYDNGVTRRMRSLPFLTYFYSEESGPLQTNSGKKIYQFKKDPYLLEKMKKWPDVFLWMLVKLNVLIDGALPPLSEVPEMKFHTDNFFNDFDIEGAFIRSNISCNKDSQILKCDLNRRYKEWYLNQYAKEPSNIKALHHRIDEHVENKQQQKFEDGWYGLQLL